MLLLATACCCQLASEDLFSITCSRSHLPSLRLLLITVVLTILHLAPQPSWNQNIHLIVQLQIRQLSDRCLALAVHTLLAFPGIALQTSSSELKPSASLGCACTAHPFLPEIAAALGITDGSISHSPCTSPFLTPHGFL